MSLLTHFLRLLEGQAPNRPVVVYGGRFQPYHRGHHAVYKSLVNHFGDDHVWVATSNKVTEDPSFLTFDERKRFMKLLGVREDRIAQAKNPAFAPHEVFKQFKEPLAYIAVGGQKNGDRYTGNDFFEPYPTDDKGQPMKFERVKDKLLPLSAKRGYYLLASQAAGGLSGTQIRKELMTGDDAARRKAFEKHLGKVDDELYKVLQDKLRVDRVSEGASDRLDSVYKEMVMELSKHVKFSSIQQNNVSTDYISGYKLSLVKLPHKIVVEVTHPPKPRGKNENENKFYDMIHNFMNQTRRDKKVSVLRTYKPDLFSFRGGSAKTLWSVIQPHVATP